jgi:protein-disulfide isomerase
LPLSRKLAHWVALGLCLGGACGCRNSSASSASDRSGASAASSQPADVKDAVLPGIDISAMTPRERHEFSVLVTSLFAPCPNVPATLAQCILEKRSCGACLQAAKWIASGVRQGGSQDTLEHAYKERFDPSSVRTLPVDGSPTKGPDDAPVTIVELADFECPHCRDAVPLMDAVLAAHPGKVRLIYKSYTLPFHAHGEPAARAAFAAGPQGKFWEMEHLLFERQEHLEQGDLERYARMLKLDVPRWKVDMDSPAVKERIDHDRKLGEELKLKGTPTIYVNGRELDVELDESLEDRVAVELGVPPVSLNPATAAASADSAKPH